MSDTSDAINSIRSDVTEVQKKVAMQEVLVNRFDSALDKISEVSLNVSKLLAVHEQRLDVHEEIVRKHEDSLSSVFEKVSVTEAGLRQEMSNGQKEILVEIKSLRSDMNTLGSDMKKQNEELKNDLEEDFSSQMSEVNQRVSKLERLSWIVIGGATVIGFIISQALGILEFGLN